MTRLLEKQGKEVPSTVEEEMKGKLTVMTIVTGVKSPWILGKIDRSEPSAEFKAMNDELGIEIVQ